MKTSFNKSKFLLDTLRVYGTVRISKTGEKSIISVQQLQESIHPVSSYTRAVHRGLFHRRLNRKL